MCDQRREVSRKREQGILSDRRGFTLVELCIVLALVGIVTTMIATFSVLINRYSQDNSADYAFYEECFDYKAEFEKEVTNMSLEQAVTGYLTENEQKVDKKTVDVVGYDHIKTATFEKNEKLIRCTLKGANNEQTFTFVVYPRVETQ